MNFLDNLTKPEYVHRPSQILRRAARIFRGAPRPRETVRLPWGTPLAIRPAEDIGRQIWAMGVFDLCVTETLWRLIEPGELAVDVGGNIGYMTSVMTVRTGGNGRVLTFEPHPDVFRDLKENVSGWPEILGWKNVTLHQTALGNRAGQAMLSVPDRFEENRGLAQICEPGADTTQTVPVEIARLADIIPGKDAVGVMKIDVEGHELAVLEGALPLLEQRRVRDIIFEERGDFPSPVAQLLQRHNYSIYAVRPPLEGPRLEPPERPVTPLRAWEVPSYLATIDPVRAQERFTAPGWQSLR